MNDAKRPQPLIPDLLLGEERLSRLYQQTPTELPPAGVDATILDAARQATRRKPRRVYFLASRKWTVPLSLAAALVITIGVVRSLRQEITSPTVVATPPAAPPSSSPARMDGRDETLLKRREQKQQQAREGLARAPQPFAAQKEAAEPNTENLSSLGAQQTEEGGVSSLHTTSAASPRDLESREKAETARAKADEMSPEKLSPGTLSPGEWIAEIKKLRHAGKMVEAEASLKAFKRRYPTYPIDKALALPHHSHEEQRGAQ